MRLRLALVACLALVAAPTHAQPEGSAGARKYAVLSLIGDALSVVTYQPRTGSLGDAHRREAIPVPDAVLDKAALLAAETELRKISAKASVVLLAPTSKALYTEQDALFAGSRLAVPDALAAILDGSGATHLVLLTKHRGDARMPTTIGNVGAGKLEGLGFYVDHHRTMRRSDTGEVGTGFLAPFAYIRFSLVDVATRAVLREEIAMASWLYSAAYSSTNADPWDALTPAQKVGVIRRTVVSEVARAVPVLVKP
jgi:hypothetical protein